MSEMFELLKEGLEDVLEHQKGKKKLKSHMLAVPELAHQYTVQDEEWTVEFFQRNEKKTE